jgi:hypothetical protein
MMLTSALVCFVSCLDACLDAVGVRPPLDRAATVIGGAYLKAAITKLLSNMEKHTEETEKEAVGQPADAA